MYDIMQDDYLEFLKNYDGLDKYVLFGLWLTDLGVGDLADKLGITRQTVYNAVKRNQAVYDKYIKTRREA